MKAEDVEQKDVENVKSWRKKMSDEVQNMFSIPGNLQIINFFQSLLHHCLQPKFIFVWGKNVL